MSGPLWAPWRIDYILSEKREGPGCVFCGLPERGPDEEELVLHVGRTAYVVMNRFPYAPGHLMVIPKAHVGDFAELAPEAAGECTELLQASVRALQASMAPQGFNLGMNVGEAAGAGIPGHLHWHVVPRWRGDTNFMPVLADVRVVPEHLRATWRKLRPALRQALEGEP